jgi:methylated-DNA-[protein]-cysteine S-methyltransferase
MDAYLDTVDSPIGPIAIAVNQRGALLRIRFVDGRYDQTIEEVLLREGYALHPSSGHADQARRELVEYWAGERTAFDVPLALRGTAWQITVWNALSDIPLGETRSYAEMAASLGNPRAARAVGRANATNRIPLVVPCHRLIGASGALTGFEGGIELKRQLLAHELRVAQAVHSAG